MAKELVNQKSAGRRSLSMQAHSLGSILQREFGITFLVFDKESGACLTGEPGTPFLSQSEGQASADGAEGDIRVRFSSDGFFHLSLRIFVSQGSALLAEGRMAFSPAEPPLREAAIRQQQRILHRWLGAVRDRLLLEGQLRHERRSVGAKTVQDSTTWDALMTLNSLARQLRAPKGQSSNQEQILKAAFGFANAHALYWIPERPELPSLIEGENLITDVEARQLAHALGQCPELKAPAPLFFNRVAMTSWGWRFPQIQTLVAFLVTDQGPLGWFVALNKRGRSLFRHTDAALLLPFVALLELHLRWSHAQ